jgi:hypothetical protein
MKQNFKLLIASLTISLVLLAKLKSKQFIIKETPKCEALCLECNNDNKSLCLVCKPGIFQYENKCYSKCPEATYPDLEWQVCRPCDSSCPICWGPLQNNCGNTPGVMTKVLLLENEIKEYFRNKAYETTGLLQWLHNASIILDKTGEHITIESSTEKSLSTDDVYGSDKMGLDLPVGSFSQNNGVFIPIPSYLDSKMNLIKSHWVYIPGMWDGHNWLKSWYPMLPSFIKYKGDNSAMYYENGGYWIYNKNCKNH